MSNKYCGSTSEKVKIKEQIQIFVSRNNSQETISATLKRQYKYLRVPRKKPLYEPQNPGEIILMIFDLIRILLGLIIKGNSST